MYWDLGVSYVGWIPVFLERDICCSLPLRRKSLATFQQYPATTVPVLVPVWGFWFHSTGEWPFILLILQLIRDNRKWLRIHSEDRWWYTGNIDICHKYFNTLCPGYSSYNRLWQYRKRPACLPLTLIVRERHPSVSGDSDLCNKLIGSILHLTGDRYSRVYCSPYTYLRETCACLTIQGGQSVSFWQG